MENNWIIPIFDGATDSIGGQSFVVGNHLITAAHVIGMLESPYVLLNGKKFGLLREEATCIKHDPSNNIDCAIYTLPAYVSSPLQMGDIETAKDKLKCLYVGYHHSSNGSVELQLKSSDAHYLGIEGNAFVCNVEPMLKDGCSGCPIISDESQVVGMLVGGDDHSMCGFQRGQYITHLMKNNEQ